MEKTYDAIIIGGGAAGLSAALTLSRARRDVLVLDAGEPRNAPAAGVHGLLGNEGIAPAELVETGRREVAAYGGAIQQSRVTAIRQDPSEEFVATLDDGTEVAGRRIILAVGLVDELPEIPGLRERWGIDLLHCPYCHGWEVKNQHIGVLATGPFSVHQALLFRQWSAKVTLFLNDAVEPDPQQFEQLAARGISVVDGPVQEVTATAGRLSGVRIDGRSHPCQALVVGPRFKARTELAQQLGLAPVQHPSGMGEYFESDPDGSTTVPGVWLAGNVRNLMAQVVHSMADGVFAGASVNNSLMLEDTARSVATAKRTSAKELAGWS